MLNEVFLKHRFLLIKTSKKTKTDLYILAKLKLYGISVICCLRNFSKSLCGFRVKKSDNRSFAIF